MVKRLNRQIFKTEKNTKTPKKLAKTPLLKKFYFKPFYNIQKQIAKLTIRQYCGLKDNVNISIQV